MPPKDVDITLENRTPQAAPDSVNLSKNQGNTILWHNKTGNDIVITFNNGTPFNGHPHPYTIKSGQKEPSGPVTANAGTTWSYTISVVGGAAADPQVIVEP